MKNYLLLVLSLPCFFSENCAFIKNLSLKSILQTISTHRRSTLIANLTLFALSKLLNYPINKRKKALEKVLTEKGKTINDYDFFIRFASTTSQLIPPTRTKPNSSKVENLILFNIDNFSSNISPTNVSPQISKDDGYTPPKEQKIDPLKNIQHLEIESSLPYDAPKKIINSYIAGSAIVIKENEEKLIPMKEIFQTGDHQNNVPGALNPSISAIGRIYLVKDNLFPFLAYNGSDALIQFKKIKLEIGDAVGIATNATNAVEALATLSNQESHAVGGLLKEPFKEIAILGDMVKISDGTYVLCCKSKTGGNHVLYSKDTRYNAYVNEGVSPFRYIFKNSKNILFSYLRNIIRTAQIITLSIVAKEYIKNIITKMIINK